MLQNVNMKLTVLTDIYYREQKDVLVVANKENKRDFIIFFLTCHIFLNIHRVQTIYKYGCTTNYFKTIFFVTW